MVGLLHPGQMGAAIAASLVRGGHPVRWYPKGRGAATHQGAHEADLNPAEDLAALLAEAHVVLSICPATAAEEVAEPPVELRCKSTMIASAVGTDVPISH
ncbi:NAD(P)-binding domain-containing protein [Nocardia sp. NBC_00881]|uniref:NAD(P)-binding domain-containing protein n=1 Tax=Nocardia sp. NBC_00881 TaxID=2975995 RepID=UPI00386DBA67|nr:NAD(P)-binding domain-containing protein [Nocardia sp. NBC_00881]